MKQEFKLKKQLNEVLSEKIDIISYDFGLNSDLELLGNDQKFLLNGFIKLCSGELKFNTFVRKCQKKKHQINPKIVNLLIEAHSLYNNLLTKSHIDCKDLL